MLFIFLHLLLQLPAVTVTGVIGVTAQQSVVEESKFVPGHVLILSLSLVGMTAL